MPPGPWCSAPAYSVRDDQFNAPTTSIRQLGIGLVHDRGLGGLPHARSVEDALGDQTHHVTIIDDSIHGPAPTRASVPGGPGHVGRQLLLEQVQRLLDRVAHGRGPTVALAGDEPEVQLLPAHVAQQDPAPTTGSRRSAPARVVRPAAASRAGTRTTPRPVPARAPRPSRSGGRTRSAQCRRPWSPGAGRPRPGPCPGTARVPRPGSPAGCAPCARGGWRRRCSARSPRDSPP